LYSYHEQEMSELGWNIAYIDFRKMKFTDHDLFALQVDTIKVAEAKAAILWVIGEYSDRIPKIAPDVLRKMAKNFTSEEVLVKLQILNLAAKLCIVNPKQTKLLAQYVFSLAKYDQNYDIRDQV
jgi:AP-3 complex subunit beta